MAIDAPAADDLPLLPADAVPARPSLAEQQRQHAAEQPPPPPGDDLPMAPAPTPSLMNSSWSQVGKQLWGQTERGLGLGTRDVIEGVSGLPVMAADAMTWLPREFQRHVLGIPTDAPSTMREKALNAVGLPMPQTPAEQVISTFNQGGAGALTWGGLGTAAGAASTAPTLANAARLLLQGGTGAVAGKTAASSDLVPWWLKPTVDAAVSILGAKASDVGFNLGAKGVNAVTGNMSPTYDAFVRAGVEPSLLGTVGGGEAGQSAEAALSRVPFASSKLRPVQQRTVDQFGQSVDRTAAQLDPTGAGITAQTTGETLQNAARNWKDMVFPQRQTQAWTPVDQLLGNETVAPSNYRGALASLTAKLAGLPETAKALIPAKTWQLLDAINQDVPAGQTMTWQQAQNLRSSIGQIMGVPEIVQSLGKDQLKRAYGGISQDMQDTAAAVDARNAAATPPGTPAPPSAVGAFNNANKVSTDGHAFIENTLDKIIKSNNPAQETVTPEQATNSILNGGDTHMQAVRAELPGAADVLAAYKLRQAQTAKPSQAGAYDDTSTGTFLTNFNRMRQDTPGGYAALYNTPAIQQQLDDLQTVAARLRETQRHLNTSGTAEQLGWMEYLRNIGETAGKGEYGKTVGAVVIPPMVGRGGGALMTSPLATRYAAARPAAVPLLPPGVGGLLGNIPGQSQTIGQ